MFGGDYPLFRYERLVDDWKALGYADDVLGDVFSGNAARLLGLPEGDA
jgi:predicted TIM-barrel fold metal-dependent hydrolase